MIHKFKFTISIEANNLSQEQYMELLQPLYDKIIEKEIIPMSFDEIDDILKLKERKFYATSVEFPNMIQDENDFEPKETNIEIKA